MPRLGYTKSRNGCMRCRQRRVKCDEKRPCSACVRHKVKCSLLDSPPPAILQREQLERDCSAAASSASPASPDSAASVISVDPRRSLPADFAQSPSSPWLGRASSSEFQSISATSSIDAEKHHAHHQHHRPGTRGAPPQTSAAGDPFPYFDKFMLPLEGEKEAAWIHDLELMHHYTVVTSLTLPRAQQELHVWQRNVPKLAFKYPFLVHQLLAVAAFHLAYLKPEQRSEHSLHASQHQNRSIEAMRGHLAEITAENCHALFMASSLLLVGAFASFANIRSNGIPLIEGQRPPSLDDMIDIFILDRGVASVLQASEEVVSAGYFRDLFHFSPHERLNPFMQHVMQELRSLDTLIKQDPAVRPMVRILVGLEIGKLIDAIEKAVPTAEDAEMRVTMYWPITIAEDYITLLRQRNEEALLVLIFYCCIIYQAEDKTWFVKGWGLNVASDVSRLISLKWRDAIKWPLEQLSQFA
ncbi:unnamed protein product [Discula destructiva]